MTFLQKKRAHWKKIIADYDQSGLSVREYCKTHGLKTSTCHGWIKRLKDESSTQAPSGFVPVKVTPQGHPPRPSVIELRVMPNQEVLIRCPDADTLLGCASLVKSLLKG